MASLERAIALAARGHEGQIDKAGAPYILHPLRVMMLVATLEEKMVAVLHDLVEDCGVSLDDLRLEGFSEAVIRGVDSVTKREDEDDYMAFVSRAAKDPIGRVVKLADLQDNSDLSRISKPTHKDIARIQKYAVAIEWIKTLP